MIDDDDRIDNNTVELPKSNHSECEDLLVAYGRWVPMRNELNWGFLPRTHPLLVREFIASNFQDTICVGTCCY